MVGVYFTFAQKAFRQDYIYRINTLIRIIGAALTILVQISIWQALYRGQTIVNGITITNMMTFVIINMVLSVITRSSIANKLSMRVKTGEIGGDFVRPVSLKYYLMAEEIGSAVYSIVFTSLPVCIISAIIVGFNAPVNILSGILFFVSVILGVVLMYYIHYVLGLLSFWLKNSLYTNFLLSACFMLFGGSTVPLWFYPSFLRVIANMLPFRFVSFEPISIYLGQTGLKGALTILGVQLAWICAFFVLEKFIWNKAQKVVTVQGG